MGEKGGLVPFHFRFILHYPYLLYKSDSAIIPSLQNYSILMKWYKDFF